MKNKLSLIKNILGQPFFENASVLIYNMDCKEGLEKLSGHPLINSTITSPPYNIGKKYEQIMVVDKYINWLADIVELIYGVTKADGNFLLNIGYLNVKGKGRAVPISYLIWDKTKFYLNQEIIWNYGAGVASKKYLSPRNEKIQWFVKDSKIYTFNLDDIRDPNVKYPNQKKNGKLRCNTIGKNPSDVWEIAKVTSGKNRASKERTGHPAQFPEDLIKRLVLGFTNKNDVILDPFIGSGTTAKVTMLNNRLCLGFETNKQYSNIIKKRLTDTEREINEEARIITLF